MGSFRCVPSVPHQQLWFILRLHQCKGYITERSFICNGLPQGADWWPLAASDTGGTRVHNSDVKLLDYASGDLKRQVLPVVPPGTPSTGTIV